MATILDIADAVVAQLNATAFSQPLTSQRHYLPRFELREMDVLHVSVVPRGLSSKAFDRGRDAFDYQVDIAVQQKVEPTAAALDPLVGLAEEIAEHFRKNPALGMRRCVEVANDPVFSPEHLEELRQFTSIVTLTIRAWQ